MRDYRRNWGYQPMTGMFFAIFIWKWKRGVLKDVVYNLQTVSPQHYCSITWLPTQISEKKIFLGKIMVKICITLPLRWIKMSNLFCHFEGAQYFVKYLVFFLESWIINQHILTDVLFCRHVWLWLPVFLLQLLER